MKLYMRSTEKREPDKIYLCDIMHVGANPCPRTFCVMNGGECCCTKDPAQALHNSYHKPIEADDKVVDGIVETTSFMFQHYNDTEGVKQYICYFAQLLGLGGFYLNAKVLSFEEFVIAYAGVDAYNVFKREGSLEDYAEAHHIRYTRALTLLGKAKAAYRIYYDASHMPLSKGTLLLFVNYYSTKLDDCEHNCARRIATALCHKYSTINQLLSATDEDISNVLNLGVKTIPYAIKLRDIIRKEMGWKDESRAEA